MQKDEPDNLWVRGVEISVVGRQTHITETEKHEVALKSFPGQSTTPVWRCSRFFWSNRHRLHDFIHVRVLASVQPKRLFDILSAGVTVGADKHFWVGGKTPSSFFMMKCLGMTDSLDFLRGSIDLEKITTVGKKLARIQLLFSSVIISEIQPESFERCSDVTRHGYVFTDGCGRIGRSLASDLVHKSGCTPYNAYGMSTPQVPTVLQIRFLGCKGVVVLSSEVGMRSIELRESMWKFDVPGEGARQGAMGHVCLVETSKPYSFGKLNKQFIMLLHGLGVPADSFLDLAEEHISMVSRVTWDPSVAVPMLLMYSHSKLDKRDSFSHLAGLILRDPDRGMQLAQDGVREIQRKELRCKKDTSHAPKIRLLSLHSRLLFGVYDQSSALRPGECFVRVTMQDRSQIISGRVVVSKSPCYLLGDVRVLHAVDLSQNRKAVSQLVKEQTVDCIVFPIQGGRPHSNEIAGSDLDGDQYFVCWDERIVSFVQPQNAYAYPESQECSVQPIATDAESLLTQFCSAGKQASVVGQIDRCYQYWADRYGSACPQCVRLGQLFATQIDAAKKGGSVPLDPELRPPESFQPLRDEQFSLPIWHTIQAKQNEQENALFATQPQRLNLAELQALLSSSPRPKEFALLQAAVSWCWAETPTSDWRVFLSKLRDLWHDINFSTFLPWERRWAVDAGVPEWMVYSPLWRSVAFTSLMLGAPEAEPRGRRAEWQDSLRSAAFCGQRRPAWGESLLPRLEDGLRRWEKLQGSDEWSVVKEAMTSTSYSEILILSQVDHEGELEPDNVAPSVGRQHRVTTQGTAVVRKLVVAVHCRPFSGHADESEAGAERPSPGCHFDLPFPGAVEVYFTSPSFKVDKKKVLVEPNYCVFLDPILQHLQIYQRPPASSETAKRDRDKMGDTFLYVKKENKSNKRGKPQAQSGLKLSIDIIGRFHLKGQHDKVRKQTVASMEVFVVRKHPDRADPFLETCLVERFHFDDRGGGQDSEHVAQVSSSENVIADDEFLDVERKGEEVCQELQNIGGSCAKLSVILRELLFCLHPDIQQFPSVREAVGGAFYEVTVLDTNETTQAPSLFSVSVEAREETTDSEEVDNRFKLEMLELGSLFVLFGFEREALSIEVFEDWQSWMLALKSDKLLNVFDTFSAIALQERPGQDSPRDTVMHLLLQQLCCIRRSAAKQGTILLDDLQLVPGPVWDEGETVEVQFVSSCGLSSATVSELHDLWVEVECSSVPHLPPSYGKVTFSATTPPKLVVALCSRHTPKVLKDPPARTPFIVSSLRWRFRDINCAVNPEVQTQNVQAARRLLNMPLLLGPGLLPPGTSTDLGAAAHDNPAHRESKSQVSVTGSWEGAGCGRNRRKGVGAEVESSEVVQLNERQTEAVQKAMQAGRSVIHGPPGTGKTLVIVEIVSRLVRDQAQQSIVFVVAETHAAVQNMTVRLVQTGIFQIDTLTVLARDSKIASDLQQYSLDYKANLLAKAQGKTDAYVVDSKGARHLDERYVKLVLAHTAVVCASVASVGLPSIQSLSHRRAFMCQAVIVDEASLTPAVSILPALALRPRLFTVVGDPNQLDLKRRYPEFRSSDNDAARTLKSLFSWLEDTGSAFTFLAVQHRMDPALAEFPSQYFYNGRLESATGISRSFGADRQGSSLSSTWPVDRHGPVCCLNVVNGAEERAGASKCNPVEAGVVASVTEVLVHAKRFTPGQVAVLTPYSGQALCLRQRLCDLGLGEVVVSTIDGFQGKEAAVVVASLVKTSPQPERARSESVSNIQRTNVLLTRARQALIVVGNMVQICSEPDLDAAASHTGRENVWTAWYRQAQEVTLDDIRMDGVFQGGEHRQVKASSRPNQGGHRNQGGDKGIGDKRLGIDARRCEEPVGVKACQRRVEAGAKGRAQRKDQTIGEFFREHEKETEEGGGGASVGMAGTRELTMGGIQPRGGGGITMARGQEGGRGGGGGGGRGRGRGRRSREREEGKA